MNGPMEIANGLVELGLAATRHVCGSSRSPVAFHPTSGK